MAAHVDAAALTGVRARFTAEILPHFVLEETLLAGLGGRGVDDLVQRTRDEHRTMLRLIARATAADPAPLGELAKILVEHVRFKERKLYPACEQRLDDDVLDRIAHAHRKAS